MESKDKTQEKAEAFALLIAFCAGHLIGSNLLIMVGI